jgi:hypothetical protein
MLKVPVYLYNNTLDIILDTDQNNRINNIMYQRNVSLQRGLKNTIQLQFKNSDQKLLDVSNETFVFSMFDDTNQRLLLEKPVEILDDGTSRNLRGLASVTLNERDTMGLESVYYRFSVKRQSESGSFEPAYANTYYGVGGTIQLLHDLEPILRPTTTVSQFQQYYNADFPAQQYEWLSGNLRANPEFAGVNALHTCAIYMTKYRGLVQIEATLENNPTSFGNYAIVTSRNYTQFSGIDYINFSGVFSYIRVRYIPNKSPENSDNNDPNYSGSVDKIMYR